MRSRVRIEVLTEEESARRLLVDALPRWLNLPDVGIAVRKFDGKPDLLQQLPAYLAGYADLRRYGDDVRVAVLVDRDTDDCAQLKRTMEAVADKAGLATRRSAHGRPYVVLNRIAVRELENWYFGDWDAVLAAFPKLQGARANVPSAFRANADACSEKTSEAFERALKRSGITKSSKVIWATRMAPKMDARRNRSVSFQAFIQGLRDLAGQ